MTSSDVIDLLVSRRYPAPEWFTLREVPPDKGDLRHLDLVAWNTFDSRGLVIDGVEVKVSRGDWLRELKNPQKTEATFSMVERFFVAAPADVVKLEELPDDWGLIEVRGGKLFNVRVPKRRERGDYSKSEVVGIMRRVQAQWSTPELVKRLQHERYEARSLARDELEEERKRLEERTRVAQRERDELLEAIGGRYSNDRMTRCAEFRSLLERFGDGKEALDKARKDARRGISDLVKLVRHIDALAVKVEAESPA